MITLNGYEINTTIFPDKTSQVWKLDDRAFLGNKFNIEFNFENESEIFHLVQLMNLIRYRRIPKPIYLHMPFLPYSRQDKEISNESTFALTSFAHIINSLNFTGITSLDTHSKEADNLINNFKNVYPREEIELATTSIKDAVIAYPDLGASMRYTFEGVSVIGYKLRDQLTGYITNYKVEGDPKGKDILIIDDICDGGMTFKLFAKELLTLGAKSVNLYITHGIFSKGIQTLRDSGIDRIFTKQGEIK